MAATFGVSVACTPEPGHALEIEVQMAAGTTVLDAIHASGVLARFAQIDISTQSVGVWGRRCALDTVLSAGDRVEIYRPLAADPKETRRRRAARR